MKTKKILNIFRWTLILPAAYIEWWLCWELVAFMDKEYRTYYVRAYNVPAFVDFMYNMMAIIFVFVVPIIAVFFTTKFLATKHKNLIAFTVMLLSVLLAVYALFTGLMNMAY